MGGISTKTDGVDFDDREEYAKWPLEAVEQAYNRLLLARKERECADLGLTRREFWETFTDYNTVIKGQFLNLPMEQYSVFDPEKKDSVYALEVFAALALFCNGELETKLKFIFLMFDFDKSNGISRDEMVMMLRCVTRALYRIGLTDFFPEYAELESLADEMFSEANGGTDREATIEEISDWATANIAANDIISRFKENPEVVLRGINRKQSMDQYHELHNGESLDNTKKNGTEDITEKKETPIKRSYKDIVPDHLLSHLRRQVSRANKMSSGRVIHRVTTQSVGKELRSDRKNMLNRVATRTCIRELTISTGFTITEVKKMRGDFAKFAGDDASLSRESFGKLLKLSFPKLTDENLLERLYSVFDANDSDSIDFNEFCLGLTRLLKGTVNEKLELLFQMYDKNGDGTIGLTELLDVVSETDEILKSEAQFASQIMHSLDVDGDGSISQSEFVQVLEKEPALMANFSRRISQRALGSLMNHRTLMTMDEGNQSFTYDGIVDLINKLGKNDTWNAAHTDHTVTIWEFKTLMRDHFEISETSVKFFDRLYHQIDKENKDKADLRDLLNALVQTLNVTDAQKAAFFFNLYDFNGKGTMNSDELLRILLEGQERTGLKAKEFLGMVRKFDNTGTNLVDCASFRDAILNNPELLHTFGMLFNATGTTDIFENETLKGHTAMGNTVIQGEQMDVIGDAKSSKPEPETADSGTTTTTTTDA
jgi:Ca2+-binding EF-hand superfamily protein